MASAAEWLAGVDVDEDHGCGDLPESVCRDVPGNATRIITAMTLQKVGDVVVDAKTVLPWLFAAVGAPPALVGLLVPIRESGSLLPQASLVPRVRRVELRKWVWVTGAAGQALAVLAMAATAALARGVLAGWVILAALAAFALARSLSSIASKDVMGRTVPKGRRGRVTGFATVAAGMLGITVGLSLRTFGGQEAVDRSVFPALLAAAALAWVVAAAVFARITEAPDEGSDGTLRQSWVSHAWSLLRRDAPFRRFVAVRTLLLVSALSPPFVVTLAAREVGTGLGELGPFVAASGVAAVVSGPLWGRYADRSSRRVMMFGAGIASVVLLLLLAVPLVTPLRDSTWIYTAAYLALALAHTGSRLGRKTYVVDLATGDQRTDYVAVSNTAMGVLLLATGAVSTALAQLGLHVALAFLAVLGLIGVISARGLPEVSNPSG